MNSIPLPASGEYDFIRQLAREYNVSVRVGELPEGVKGYKLDNTIFLNEKILAERRNWTFCHELGHIVLGHSADPSDYEEREADEFAAETMLPRRDFIPDSRDIDLARLKELYPHASYEVLARRCIQFHPAVLTIFDQERLTSRTGSPELSFPSEPTEDELRVKEECYQRKDGYTLDSGALKISGYYIDIGLEVIRVILISKPDDVFFE